MKLPFFEIEWGAPGNSWALLSVVIVAVCLMYRYRRSRYVARYLASQPHSMHLLLNFSLKRLIGKTLLIIVGTLCVSLALLMPRWGTKEYSVQQEGRDLLIALDISRSMLARDCVPDRLSCAKQKIISLLQYLSCERVGLILFSGTAFVQCPLTTDYGAFKSFLEQVDVETIASGSTALDQAIVQALRIYQETPHGKNKLLVIVTDGEDFSYNLTGIQQQAIQLGMHIFTIGVGTAQGAPIPLYNERGVQQGHQKDKQGTIVISRLNETIVRRLADEVGGSYVRMSVGNDTDVQEISRCIASFEKERLDDVKMSSCQEQYPYFIGAALVFFMLEWFL